MARIRAALPACAVVVVCAVFAPVWAATPDDGSDLDVTLKVQNAMGRGRALLLGCKYQEAVDVLETQLPFIRGNRAYLALLRDAYLAYLRELRLTNQPAAFQKYTRRLQILDPDVKLETPGQPTATVVSVAAVPAVRERTAASTSPLPAASVKAPVYRAVPEAETDTPRPADPARAKAVREVVAKAVEEWQQHRYREARLLFEEADHRDQNAVDPKNRECWAYCMLYQVVEQLNRPAAGPLAWTELEQDVKTAITLAPRLESKYGGYLLGELRKRRAAAPEGVRTASAVRPAQPVSVKHGERTASGFQVAESPNFVVLHQQTNEMAEQVAQIAERTRTAMFARWFGGGDKVWTPKCEIVLHANGDAYSQATHVPASSPGHSSISSEGGRVVARKIDLRCDEVNLLTAVLPHETTHVVLAGQFGGHEVPRWADEGIAVLSEPPDRIDRHLRMLPQHARQRHLFGVGRLMQLSNYPEARFIGPFYAQSVSVVDFLSRERGPQAVTAFLREALRTGQYEAALTTHFGIRDFDELQRRWERHALGDPVAASTPGVTP